jgi:hypothetical protein
MPLPLPIASSRQKEKKMNKVVTLAQVARWFHQNSIWPFVVRWEPTSNTFRCTPKDSGFPEWVLREEEDGTLRVLDFTH